MTGPVALPLALVEGFAAVWCRLSGGSWQSLQTAAGTVVVWTSPDGRSEALPDRMYGVAGTTMDRIDPADFPADLGINLPPGVTAEGAEVHAVGHQLVASDRDEAWASLRRVGRQGVLKARRTGCVVSEITDAEYLDLAAAKAARFDAPAPPPDLVAALRQNFGSDHVGVAGVTVSTPDGPAVASAVLWLRVGEYGMLVDGASERAHWDKNPNNLAVWTAIGGLIDSGCTRVDFGFSAPGAGDLRFKDHMGGREVALYRLQR